MTSAGAAGAHSDVQLGLLRAADLDLALPLASLREAVPCPAELQPVPVTAPGLLGVMSLRSHVVPVVDLAVLLGRPHERRPGQVVVLLADGSRLLGMLVDEVRGMVQLPAAALQPLQRSGDPLLSPATFVHREDGQVVAVLDPAVVLDLPGLPCAQEAVGGEATTAVTQRRSRSLTVVRCGTELLALDVADVHSTVPHPAPRPSPADGPLCLGVTTVLGHDVAVTDLLGLLNRGGLSPEDLGCGVVVELADGRVVLGISEVLGLRDVADDDVLALPASSAPTSPLLSAAVFFPDLGTCLLVDGAGLHADPLVVSLSRLSTPVGAAAGDEVTRAALTGPAHLRFDLGVTVACPLDQVAEVLDWPSELRPVSGRPEVLGLVVHRGRALPVVDLAAVVGAGPVPLGPSSRLLLLDGAVPVTFAVPALQAILPRTWVDDSPGAREGATLRGAALAQLGDDPALVPVLDLRAVARRLVEIDLPAPRDGDEWVPPAGFEPALPPPEGDALSPELRGLGALRR